MTNQDGQEYVDCSVIIVTYNSARYIDGLLASLPAAAAGLTLRTVVVDNGSADDTVARVRLPPGVTCVETGANLGFAAAAQVKIGSSRRWPSSSVTVAPTRCAPIRR